MHDQEGERPKEDHHQSQTPESPPQQNHTPFDTNRPNPILSTIASPLSHLHTPKIQRFVHIVCLITINTTTPTHQPQQNTQQRPTIDTHTHLPTINNRTNQTNTSSKHKRSKHSTYKANNRRRLTPSGNIDHKHCLPSTRPTRGCQSYRKQHNNNNNNNNICDRKIQYDDHHNDDDDDSIGGTRVASDTDKTSYTIIHCNTTDVVVITILAAIKQKYYSSIQSVFQLNVGPYQDYSIGNTLRKYSSSADALPFNPYHSQNGI